MYYFDFFRNSIDSAFGKAQNLFQKKKIGVLTKIAFLCEFDDSINQLFTLRKAGPIEEAKQKNFIYYSLNLTVFEEILTWIQSLGGKEDEK